MDADGYGYKADEKGPARVLEDLRTLSPLGIERAAAGWDAHASSRLDHFRAAETAALRALEEAHVAPVWRAEHGDTGHKAENATLGAAIGVVARDRIDHKDYETLVRPLAEALPWLLID